ncbi:Zn-ribbon domain-containing OB-fold protein [Achromobacter xylosoxidans]|uniref:Zn-ribbon domain-containing OB-fold protein n=1 Tax=Alcaligenes xylosoxydans xylosoxydans TaxID=85698 RepID=UPI000B490424|nr:Zn-ribbon domain-containing OB-fold protein [Achromobacter xylosoxidans]
MNMENHAKNLEQDPYAQANPETLPFWEAAAQGRLVLPRCRACGQCHWYPRGICPLCGSASLDWVDAQGSGTLYSFSVMRASAQPYAIAYVQLAEGPLLLTNIVDCDLDRLRIGQAMRAAFRPAPEGRCSPVFTVMPD